MTATLPERLETIAALRSELGSELERTRPLQRTLAAHPALEPLLNPGLRIGTAHSVTGSTTLALALVAGPSMNGSWCATVGFPNLGAECAAEWSIDLDRLILVPKIEPAQWIGTISALIEAVDVVLACPPPALPSGVRNKLHARLRHREATLIVAGRWPQAGSRLETVGDRWLGLDAGHGHLMSRELTIRHTRGHHSRSTVVTWPPSHQ